MPFSDLTVSEIRSVELYGPSGEIVCALSEDEKAAFVELLNQIVISNTGNYEYQRCSGSQPEMFLITWNNGDQTVVALSNPYFVLNGKGYACENKEILVALFDLYKQHFR